MLLTDDQHRLLLKLAKVQRKPLSVLLREGVVEQVIKETRRAAKRQACDEIAAIWGSDRGSRCRARRHHAE